MTHDGKSDTSGNDQKKSGQLYLHDRLFQQLDRLSDANLKGKELGEEVTRSKAVVAVSDQIVACANLQLSAATLYGRHGNVILPHLPLIGRATGS